MKRKPKGLTVVVGDVVDLTRIPKRVLVRAFTERLKQAIAAQAGVVPADAVRVP